MNKLRLFICLIVCALKGINADVYAVTMTDNFTTADYGAPPANIIGQGHGSGDWGGSVWTGSNSPTFVTDTTIGSISHGKYAGSGDSSAANRTFTSFNIDSTTQISFKIATNSVSLESPTLNLYDNSGNTVCSIFFGVAGEDIIILNANSGSYPITNYGGTSANTDYTVTIKNFNTVNHTFEASSVLTKTVPYDESCTTLASVGIYGTGSNVYIRDLQISNVPEPSAIALLSIGLLGLAGGIFKKRARNICA